MIKPLDDLAEAIRWIAEVSDSSEDEVRNLLRAEVQEIGTNVHSRMVAGEIPFYQTSEKLDALWNTDACLYELTVWNACDTKQQMRAFVNDKLQQSGRGKGRLFCFGDGLGLDSTWFTQKGHESLYYEPSAIGQQFANRVFAANEVDVKRLASLDDIEPHSLDTIVCLDVLEHIPKPQNLIAMFHKWLKPDGLLFVHAPFWFLHWTRATHLKENRHLSGDLKTMYHRHGFSEVDAPIFWNPIMLQRRDSPAPVRKRMAGRIRIRVGQLLLTIGRWNSVFHSAIARVIAKAPNRWAQTLAMEAPSIPLRVVPKEQTIKP